MCKIMLNIQSNFHKHSLQFISESELTDNVYAAHAGNFSAFKSLYISFSVRLFNFSLVTGLYISLIVFCCLAAVVNQD